MFNSLLLAGRPVGERPRGGQALHASRHLSLTKNQICANITHHAVVKPSEQAMCSLSASTPLQLIEAIEADSGTVAGPHTHPLCSFLPTCVCAAFPLSQGGSRPALTLCDRSFSHSQLCCLRTSPSPSIPLSLLLMLLQVLHPPHSPPRLLVCILFLGPLISLLSFILVPS